MPLAAVVKISSAWPNAEPSVRFPKISRKRSLEITRNESTYFFISSKPSSACILRRLPSKEKGVVTIPTTKISNSFAAFAIIGLAPVPVPPPIPAVINNILVLAPNISLISSIFSIAEFLPTSGIEPAPIPSVRLAPNCTLFGMGLSSNACASVLQIMKSTPVMP